jgi:hypothetical protein
MQLGIYQQRVAAAQPRRSAASVIIAAPRVLPRQAIRQGVCVRAGGKLDEVSLFGGSTADLLGGGAAGGKSGAATAAATLETVELKSKVRVFFVCWCL